MFIDTQNEFSDDQAVTATAISANVYDTQSEDQSNTLQNFGVGHAPYLVVQVDETFTAAGAATLDINFESDSVAALSASPTVHFSSAQFAVGDLIAGTRLFAVRLPQDNYERYLGLRYTVGTGPFTAGKISAFITDEVNANKQYASGFTV